MNITTYYTKTNYYFLTTIKNIEIFNIHSIKTNNINNLLYLFVNINGTCIWKIDFNSILKDINKIKIKDNTIIFSNDLFFVNNDQIYVYKTFSVNIYIESKENMNCELNLINSFAINKNYNTLINYIYDYEYIKLTNMNKTKEIYDLNLIDIFMKGSRIYKINNINYNIIKKTIIFNNNNIRIIKTINSLNLIKDILNKILQYCDIYEYTYKLLFNNNKINTNIIEFDKEFNGEILIIRHNYILYSSLGCSKSCFYY